MHLVQVLAKHVAVEEIFLAKIAPGVRQNLSSSIIRWVAVFDVRAQLLHVVDPLFADKDRATFQADQAESLLMGLLHMAPQTLLVRELLFVLAV